jgi:hemerythrin-like domain-containing protein
MNAMDMRTSEMGMTVNAIDLLTQDHRTVDEIIAQLETLGNQKEGSALPEEMNFESFKKEFLLHGQVEEQIFYPALKANPETADLVPEAVHEHQEVKELIARMETLAPDSSEFQELLAQAKADIKHHVGEEENEMFVKARHVLGEQKLEELGRQILQMKQRENPQQAATAGAATSM